MVNLAEEVWDFIIGLGLAFIVYSSMGYALDTDMPLTAVVSDSMEPVYYKGDMLLVVGTEDIEVSDVIIYQNPTTNLPIVHRVIEITEDGRYITKGDNNALDDVTGGIVPAPIPHSALHGKSIFKMPYLGWVKIVFLRYVVGFPV